MPQRLERPAVLNMLHQSPVAVRKDDDEIISWPVDPAFWIRNAVLLNGGVGYSGRYLTVRNNDS